MSRRLPDLVKLFDGLPAPVAETGLGRFCVQPLPGFTAFAIGKDASGNPVLLVNADNTHAGTAAPLVLEHLAVIHIVNCRVQSPDSTERHCVLSVIRCTGEDRSLHEYFLRALHPIIASLPTAPSRDDISSAVQRLVDLFRKLSAFPRKTIVGLWAELFVLARAHDPTTLLAGWHALQEDRFDFAFGIDRLEVKSASGGHRIHHFALEQLRPIGQTRVLIASLLVERVEGGTSINDLVDSVRQRIADPILLIRLDSIVAETLGQDWRSTQQTRFDLQRAVHSLRFFDATMIPAVAVPLPAKISGVHFKVDLSDYSMPPPADFIGGSPLFRAAIPVSDA